MSILLLSILPVLASVSAFAPDPTYRLKDTAGEILRRGAYMSEAILANADDCGGHRACRASLARSARVNAQCYFAAVAIFEQCEDLACQRDAVALLPDYLDAFSAVALERGFCYHSRRRTPQAGK